MWGDDLNPPAPAPPIPEPQHVAGQEGVAPVVSEYALLRRLRTPLHRAWLEACRPRFRLYREAREAENPARIVEALRQILLLPQQALRRRAGGRALKINEIKAHLAALNMYMHGDAAGIGAPAQVPVAPEADQDEQEEKHDPDANVSLIRRCTDLVEAGHIGKAARMLTSSQIAEVCPETIAQLEQLHIPQRDPARPLPVEPAGMLAVPVEQNALKNVIKQYARKASAPGPSGWTGELLKPLVDDAELMSTLTEIVEDLLSGNMPAAAHSLLSAARELPFVKPNGGVRPINPAEAIMQVAEQYALRLIPHHALQEIFGGIQYAVGARGGSEAAVHVLQTAIETGGPDVCMFAPDLRNAFGTVRRAAILTELYKHDALRPIAKLARWVLERPSPLYLQGQDGRVAHVFLGGEGIKQGGSLGPLLFSLGTISILRQVKDAHPHLRIAAIMDDAAMVGIPEDVVPAARQLKQLLTADALEMQPEKTTFLWPHTDRPPPNLLSDAAREFGWQTKLGAMVHLGAPIGLGVARAALTNEHIRAVIEEHTKFFQMLIHPQMSAQVAVLLLQASAAPRMNYITRTLPPGGDTGTLLRLFDERARDTLFTICQINENDLGSNPIMQTSLPVSIGGMGLRRTSTTHDAAFWSAAHSYAEDIRPLIEAARVRQAAAVQINPANINNTPLQATLAEIHHRLRAFGVQPAPGVFPEQAQNSLDFYGPRGAPDRLQSAIFKQIEARIAIDIHRRSDPADQARLASLRLPHAGTWLRVFPSAPVNRLSNLQVAIAAKLRLGLPLSNVLPVMCPCCQEVGALGRDATHFLGCPRMARTGLTRRHDAIVQHIAAWCNSMQFPAVVEPKIDGERRRPDVEIILERGRLAVDVSVVHPAAPTYINHHHATVSATAPITARENQKNSKYRATVARAGAEFLPFVTSSFGGFGAAAMRFFSILRESVDAMDPIAWSSDPVGDLIRDLCVVIQRGNASATCEGHRKLGELQRYHAPLRQAPPRAHPQAAAGQVHGQANLANGEGPEGQLPQAPQMVAAVEAPELEDV